MSLDDFYPHLVQMLHLKTLRDNVAMVLQKNVLFSGTIKENMRWGNDDAKAFLEFIYSDEGVQIMAESGNIVPTTDMMDRVAAMEDGYTKEFFSVYNEATPAFGAFAPYNTENLPDFDRAATVFGSIDSLATGKITADEYQSTLADAWVKLSENKLNAE